MSNFWKLYASVSDDVRHKLVEEGWFGRPVTGNITEQDMPGITPAEPSALTTPNSYYASPRVSEAKMADLYGSDPAPTSKDKGLEPEI